jgi:hypothetical protein
MVDRHYSLNLKPWSARTIYVYAHADLAQKHSVGLQEIFVSRLCSQEGNYFFLSWPNLFSVSSHHITDVLSWINSIVVAFKCRLGGQGRKCLHIDVRFWFASQGNEELC